MAGFGLPSATLTLTPISASSASPFFYLIVRISQERCVGDQELLEGRLLLGGLSQRPVRVQIPVVDVLPDRLGVLTGGP